VNVFNPDNGWEVALVAFIVLCVTFSSVYPVWAKLKKIDGQVSNSHEENLRDEITRGFREIREDIKVLRAEHRELRADLRTERIERIEGDKRKEVA